jgi:hypothetical protein
MTGTTKDDVDLEKMPNAELHAHFTQLLVGRAHDVDTRLGDVDSMLSYVMEKIDGLEEAIIFHGFHGEDSRYSMSQMLCLVT